MLGSSCTEYTECLLLAVTVHNGRCVHGSPPNRSPHSRPLFLATFAPADSQLIHAGTNPLHFRARKKPQIVRGASSNLAVFDSCARNVFFGAGVKQSALARSL